MAENIIIAVSFSYATQDLTAANVYGGVSGILFLEFNSGRIIECTKSGSASFVVKFASVEAMLDIISRILKMYTYFINIRIGEYEEV